MSTEKAYLVRFCVRDCYRIVLVAADADDALDKAQLLYEEECEAAFEFDFDDGGTCDWDAEEVRS